IGAGLSVFLEVGAGKSFTNMFGQQPNRQPHMRAFASMRHPNEDLSDHAVLLQTLGRLHLAGVAVDWRAFYGDEKRRRVVLPTYPFQGKRHWVEAMATTDPTSATGGTGDESHTAAAEGLTGARNGLEREIMAAWQEILGNRAIDVHDNFF